MPGSATPLFLARRSYRRRRMMDAARLLPLVGLVLILLPMLWHPADTPIPDTARGMIYLFSVWVGLILAAAALARGLAPALDAEEEAEGSTPEPGDS
ncbi:hypothetical protein C8J30_11228 [Rhodobacter viridis]|uniref:Uncharacterized protein n=1 Tax=Rhodobacter viridis TaxID=1054202 RepID=A0A318TUX9_9RHOB|nr:hypothetical protein [Rhodobacter viridis]PYF08612.1 hypothetical protein C8J30_11228 [Rhodobacter viridis]